MKMLHWINMKYKLIWYAEKCVGIYKKAHTKQQMLLNENNNNNIDS